jgi:hypothetical protein
VTGVLLFQIRFFATNKDAPKDAPQESEADPRLRVLLLIVLSATIFGSLEAIREGWGRWSAVLVTVTHPVFNAGGFDGDGADAPFVIEGSYLDDRRRFEAVVEEDGVQMRFAGWADSLEAYTRPLETVGLLIERLREPRVPASYASRTPSGEAWRWDRIPMFLWFRALKPA